MFDKKLCLVCSSGGHLKQLYLLKPLWEKFGRRFWITFHKVDALSLLKKEKVYFAYYPTNRNLKNLIKNTFLAFKILPKEKPNLIISNGAGVAVPFFYVGKLLGAKLIYIEVYDRVNLPTLTGKLVYPICDKFIIQWPQQKKFYPKSIYIGSIL